MFLQAELWIIVIGFSLGFGAMFSKTWRVHVIFLNSSTTKRVMQVLCLFKFCFIGFFTEVPTRSLRYDLARIVGTSCPMPSYLC